MEELRISGLDELDADELSEALPSGDIRIESARSGVTPEGVHYEPMTILAVIVISSAAIRGLSAWLLKKRHRRSVEFDVEIRHTDGSVERRHVKFEFTESSSEPEIVKQVGEKFGIDPAVVGEALAHLSG